MRRVGLMSSLLAITLPLIVAACGDDATSPTDATFGETTFVILVNPPLNDANQPPFRRPGLPAPG